VSEPPAPADSPYDEWGRLTRFLESARLAFARERNLWASLGIDEPEQVRISAPPDGGRYNVTVVQHIEAVDDAETLHGSVLVHSYALAESAAASRLAIDPRSFGGIEDWGARLLSRNGRDWSDVKGGLAGPVEVAVARNAFAHGSRAVDASAQSRLLAAGARTRPPGARVKLTYAELREFRARLSLCTPPRSWPPSPCSWRLAAPRSPRPAQPPCSPSGQAVRTRSTARTHPRPPSPAG
jgi:hypothetical protein